MIEKFSISVKKQESENEFCVGDRSFKNQATSQIVFNFCRLFNNGMEAKCLEFKAIICDCTKIYVACFSDAIHS